MSGIYIPGVKMPRKTGIVSIVLAGDGSALLCEDGAYSDITVIPVPDHGRLGDLDVAVEILERLRDHCGNEDMAFALNWAAGSLRDLPTIIPADKKGDEP